MMPLIKIIQLAAILLIPSAAESQQSTTESCSGKEVISTSLGSFCFKPSDFTKNNTFDLDKCLKKYGASGTLGPLCHIEKSKEYERKTNKIHNDLMKKVPNASKKLLTTYRQNFKNNLVMCELHFQAYNNWGKPDNHPTIADMEQAQCIYDMRKEEYQYYKKLLCLPNYSCYD